MAELRYYPVDVKPLRHCSSLLRISCVVVLVPLLCACQPIDRVRPAETENLNPSSASGRPYTPPPPPTPTPTEDPHLPPAAGAPVAIITSDVTPSALTVTAMVVGVSENNGSCTLIAVRGSSRLTDVSPVQAGPQSTYCSEMAVAREKLSPGTWVIQVAYTSLSTSGVSEPKAVTVP